MSRSLLSRLPKGLVCLLRAIGNVGGARGCAAYLVGGLVRDLVLRRENYDIDIVVETDAIAYARAVAQKFHAQGFVSYPRFGTATVLLKWPRSIPRIRKQAVMRIDFSTARKEQYEYPAALPSVKGASIHEDLLRRDFTMNAMALCLDRGRFGTLLDYFSGRKDIADKKVAVLHENSFIDDPTRIFRAVRFASRYRFCIEPRTRNYIRHAAAAKMIQKLSMHRLREELILLLSEEDPHKVLRMMASLDELRFIHPRLHYTPALRRHFAQIQKTLQWYEKHFKEPSLERWVLYCGALFAPLNVRQLKWLLERLEVSRRHRAILLEIHSCAPEIAERLTHSAAQRPSALYDMLEPYLRETIVYAVAIAASQTARQQAYKFLAHYSQVRLSVNGEDIAALGVPRGPLYGRILRMVHNEKLDRGIVSRQQELHSLRAIVSRLQAPAGKNSKITYRQQKPKVLK